MEHRGVTLADVAGTTTRRRESDYVSGMKSTMTGGEAVVRALEAHGVEYVFGIPGTHTLPIDKYLPGSSIRHVQPRHEQGAGFAADGYARATGRASVCIVTSGPGVTNLATAAAQAYSDSVPMLVISPGMPGDVYGRGTGYLHEAKDQSKAMDNLVGWSHRATSPSDVAQSVYRAFAEFASSRPRPVHLEIPLDVLDASEPVSLSAPVRPGRPEPSPSSIQQALGILASARRPGLLVGGGAQDAAGEVRDLAHVLDAIVITTYNGKGAFPEDDQLAVGVALGYPSGRAALAECDVVIAAGTEVSSVDLESEPLDLPGSVIRIDIDAGQLNMNLAADCGIHADAAIAIRRLLAALNPAQRRGAARAREARARLDRDVELRAAGSAVAARAIQNCLDDETIVVCDTSMLCYNGIIPARFARTPRSCLNPTGFATLGYALPAGIGAKLGKPDRNVVVVSGDGGILFTLSELSLAVQLQLQLPIVVVNNRGYGEIRQAMISRGIEPFGVTFDPPRFPQVAEAFGARGELVTEPAGLERALRDAFRAEGPTLIEAAL
jgi:thiamine pyrophosphate-dependent acetolactate synthase large subunit-like protein